MEPRDITTAQSLLEALDERSGDPQAKADFDARIWERFGVEAAVLVTDLSGFTRTTAAHGILHFLSLFRRFQRLCLPIMDAHGGALMKQEADDLFGIFETAADAIDAARDMLLAVRRANAGVPDAEPLGLCIGVDYGRMLRMSDDAFGSAVNIAFKLGEDIADPGELLIGRGAHDRAVAAGYDFSRWTVDGPRTAALSRVELEHFSLRPKPESDELT